MTNNGGCPVERERTEIPAIARDKGGSLIISFEVLAMTSMSSNTTLAVYGHILAPNHVFTSMPIHFLI